MAADDETTDSTDEAPDRPEGAGPSLTDELDEAVFGDVRPNDPTLVATGDDDPMTAEAGETGYPGGPD